MALPHHWRFRLKAHGLVMSITPFLNGERFDAETRRILAQSALDSSRTDSLVRILHAQLASGVSVTHVQAEKIVGHFGEQPRRGRAGLENLNRAISGVSA